MRKLLAFILMLSVFVTPFSANAAEISNTVIIDAGHGGVDGGAVGVSGTYEKEINLDIALRLHDLMEFLGYNVIMTRRTDISIHDETATTIRQMKASDLKNRLKITTENPDAIYISIHQNKFSDPSQDGMCFYYSSNNDKSKLYADILHENLLKYFQPDNRRKVKAAESNLYILYNSLIPTVLVECGFVSNENEEKLLKSENYQRQISQLIAISVMQVA